MGQRTIALITDFGIDDPYVGIMKGVINQIASKVNLIDLTHQIPPGDIQRGAFVLWQAVRDFPTGTIFLCVVDPGVGTKRKAIYLKCGEKIFIGPDNGLFSYITYKNDYSAWELSNPKFQLENPSSTFHGRDIFAPAAAYASRGARGQNFGKGQTDLVRLPTPRLSVEDNAITGEVLSLDRFGNLITSLGQFISREGSLEFSSWLDSSVFTVKLNDNTRISLRDIPLQLKNNFESVPDGECAALIGSTGLIEIVTNQASASYVLGSKIGDPVSLMW